MNKIHLKGITPIALIIGLAGTTVVNANEFYVAASSLYAEYDDDIDDSGYSAAIGKYIGPGKYASLEVGYTDFGESSASNSGIDGEFEATAVQFSVIGYLPLSSRAGIYTRVGTERIKTDVSVNNVRTNVKETNPFYGFGGYYTVIDNIDVRVEYQRHETLDEYIDTYSAGLTVKSF